MRPIAIRKTSRLKRLQDYGGMIYIFKIKYDSSEGQRWWNLSTRRFCYPEDVILLKRKLPTIEGSTSD